MGKYYKNIKEIISKGIINNQKRIPSVVMPKDFLDLAIGKEDELVAVGDKGVYKYAGSAGDMEQRKEFYADLQRGGSKSLNFYLFDKKDLERIENNFKSKRAFGADSSSQMAEQSFRAKIDKERSFPDSSRSK